MHDVLHPRLLERCRRAFASRSTGRVVNAVEKVGAHLWLDPNCHHNEELELPPVAIVAAPGAEFGSETLELRDRAACMWHETHDRLVVGTRVVVFE